MSAKLLQNVVLPAGSLFALVSKSPYRKFTSYFTMYFTINQRKSKLTSFIYMNKRFIIMNGDNMKDVKILLGKRIKELRKKLNISQQELASMVNVDPRNLSNIECGISFPSKILFELSKALKVTLP